jgi:adenine-specific DNA-methyltransferase
MKPRRDDDPRLRGFARTMRRQSTDAERRLWSILRDRRLGGFKFRRQHPMQGFVLDFYCVAARLAIELDGGQHLDPDGLRYDQRRAAKLTQCGVRIVRFPDDQLLKYPEAVADAIYEELMKSGPHPGPHPSPLPEYRERG